MGLGVGFCGRPERLDRGKGEQDKRGKEESTYVGISAFPLTLSPLPLFTFSPVHLDRVEPEPKFVVDSI